MEFISIGISTLALIASSVSVYFQFFHRPRALRLITFPPSVSKGHTRFGLCNGSKESVYITSLAIEYRTELEAYQITEPAGDITLEGSRIIEPGKITEFYYTTRKPSSDTMDRLKAKVNLSGEMEKEIGIYAYIQFAFASGHVYSNDCKTGTYMESENSKGGSIAGLNINLLKGALPVLKERV